MGATKIKPPSQENENFYINIDQLDGNISLESNCISCDSITVVSDLNETPHQVFEQTWKKSAPQNIPVILNTSFKYVQDPPAWYEHYTPKNANLQEPKNNRITIRRDNRLIFGESLPIISVSNLRSLGPKLKNFKIDMLEREIGVSLLSEVWEKTECKKQQHELEKMFQMDGLKYISTPRTQKRGGGAAVVVNIVQFSLEKIEVVIPHKLEVVWGPVGPEKKTSKIRKS